MTQFGSAPRGALRKTAAAAATATALACGLAAPPAAAAELLQNISYNAPLNPWSAGSPLVESWAQSFGGSLALNVPTVDLSASGLLASVLDLPKIGFVESSIQGRAGLWLDLGYAISGGVLALKYPGQARLDFGSDVAAGRYNGVATGFTPGLQRTVMQPGAALANVLGVGYRAPAGLEGAWAWDSYRTPGFTTAFPSAAAWATLRYDAQASLGITAGVARALGECVLCKRFDATVQAADTIPLLKIDARGVEVAGLPPVPLFGQSFGLGAATVELNYPDVKVPGVLAADGRTLSGQGTANLLRFDAPLEKLVPLVGAFLSQRVGPVDLTLLSAAGGPELGVTQRFDVAVAPKVRLEFGTLVQFRRGGESFAGREITVDLGESFEWKPFMPRTGEITVRPTYLLDGTLHNSTGLSVGVHLNVDALRAEVPPLPAMGPQPVVRLVDPALATIPLYDQSFPIQLDPVTGTPLKLAVAASFADGATLDVHLNAVELLGAPAGQPVRPGASGTWRLSFDSGLGAFSVQASGRAAGVRLEEGVPAALRGGDVGFYAGPEDATLLSDLVLLTDGELSASLQQADAAAPGGWRERSLALGSLFCIVCSDVATQLGDQGNFIDDGLGRLYMNRLDTAFVDAGVASSFSTAHEILRVPQVTQQISAVPELPAALLLPAGLGLLLGWRRRGALTR